MGSPALFSGTMVKFLKDKLNLFDKAFILTGTQDPRVTATDAPKGSILLRQTASGNGQVFFKLDNGSSTNWKLFSADTTAGSVVLESIKNTLVDSTYSLVTTNIGAFDGSAKWATLTGAAFDTATDSIKFTANAQIATSINMLDVNEYFPLSTDLTEIDLSVYWNRAGAVPTGFTYEVSRDGGVNYFTMTMSQVGSTNAFHGTLRFGTGTTTESVSTSLSNVTGGSEVNRAINATTSQRVSRSFVVPAGECWVVDTAIMKLSKNGTPNGSLYAALVRDSGGFPSTTAGDTLAISSPETASGLVTGNNTFAIPSTVLIAGTYHVVLYGDSAYYAGWAAPNSIDAVENDTTSGASIYNGTSWSAISGKSLTSEVKGRKLDLRIKLTSAGSPSYPCYLDGYGVFYGLLSQGVQTGTGKKIQKFQFDSVADNLDEFVITAFSPDPDLITCWYVEGGQGFKVPSFELYGSTARFPANTFYNGGISTTITLIFEQASGIYDNSDSNARLLAANHLGSEDLQDDRSLSGRGLFLRRPDGTLREITIDDSDNIVVYSI